MVCGRGLEIVSGLVFRRRRGLLSDHLIGGKMSPTRLLVAFLLALSHLPSTAWAAESSKPYPGPGPLYLASVDGHAIALHDFAGGSFGLFEVAQPVEVEVRAGFDVHWVDIRPKSAGIVPVIASNHRSVRFRMTSAVPATVEFNGDIEKVLHLFAYRPEKDAPKPGAANIRYFGPGTHEPGLIEIKDGETLYLAPGAWVKGNVRSIGTKNVSIRGRGVLDGSNIGGRVATGPGRRGMRNMIYLERTENAEIEGVTLFNSFTWTVYITSANDTKIDGVRILNPTVNNGNDGFDIVSSSNVRVENVFVRTNDDCVVVKNLDDVDTHDITVRHAVLWNMPNGGNGVETGFELRNHKVHDIRFEDIDMIHIQRGAAISIHNGDAAWVENVTYDNIRVEDVRRKLIDIAVVYAQYGADRPKDDAENTLRMDRGGAWDGVLSYTAEEKPARAKFRGHIKGIRITNLHVVEGALPYSVIAGFDYEYAVEDVVIEGLEYQGRPIRNAADAKLTTEYARGVEIK